MDRNKALLVYSGWLGDFVWIVPMVKAMRTRFPALSIVVSEVQGPLAVSLQGAIFDDVLVDCSRNRASVARNVRGIAVANDIGTYIDIKGRGKAGLFMPWRRDADVFMPSRNDAREYWLARLLHPLAVAMPGRNHSGHMVEQYLDVAKFFGVTDPKVDFDIPFDERTVAEADRICEREGLKTGRTIAISPGSAQFSKIWPAKNYRALAEILGRDLKCKVVIMGARDFAPNGNYDLAVSREHFSDGQFVNLIERTQIVVDSCLFRSGVFDVAVGNDSFAGHMAGSAGEVAAGTKGAVRTPDGKHYEANYTVSLFGPTNPRFCRPYDPTGEFNLVVTPAGYPSDCVYNRKDHICPHYGDRTCAGSHHCMEGITVEQVVRAVETQLEKARLRGTGSRKPGSGLADPARRNL